MDMIRLLVTIVMGIAITEAAYGQPASDYRQSTDSGVPTRMTRQRGFGIPFQLSANSSGAAEVRLYVSSDQGVDWKMYQHQPPSSKGFQFQAETDGEYWFAVRTVDNRGELIAHQGFQPELKVIVDTQLPRREVKSLPPSSSGTSANDRGDGLGDQLPNWLTEVQHTNDAFGAASASQTMDRNVLRRSENKWNGQPSDHDATQRPQPYRSAVSDPVANRHPQGLGESMEQRQDRPRITQSPNFELDYDLYDVGPQGARLVELWISRDRGRTWQLHGSDPDKESPVQVRLKKEGLYGFRLAVHGHNATAPPAPRNGAPADIWVGVDWTKPAGRITRAKFLPEPQADTLLIEWTAVDALMAEEPITLSFSDSRDGPWKPFAANLRNSGSFRWKVDQQLSDRAYLQLEVRDLAGSITTSVFGSAVSAQGQNPTGRIRDVRPIPRTTQKPVFIR